MRNFDESQKRLGLEYIDIYLIHSPHFVGGAESYYGLNNLDLWRAMERLYKEKRVRAIGLSNFSISYLAPIIEQAEIKPMINQVELHPAHQSKPLVKYCEKNGVLLEAYCPLMRAGVEELPKKRLEHLGQSYGRTWAQIALRWSLQKGFLPLTKSVHEDRIRENLNIFDFEISDEDMKFIESLDGRGTFGNDPDEAAAGMLTYLVQRNRMLDWRTAGKSWLRLFGFIPLLKIKRKRDGRIKFYLFGFIPFLVLKSK
jgi:diketogulonate reductase-like aldo/keto reductase